MSKILNSSKITPTPSLSPKRASKVIVKQPISVLKKKRKFTNKTTKPSVHFDSKQQVKDEYGNISDEPVNWMKRPSILPNQPNGLEYLKSLDILLIQTTVASLVSEKNYVIKGEQGFEEFKVLNCKFNCV